ncbi:hypothetical protein Ngar_c18940 [Candidatus Nitrososphaera gargensis Ga9.2]|uniref:Uncharacterized protein n=1 Tax=Nitrososphaera gargensis (strain Ga9.2) TaxID=1237085 RepID=K0IBY6_NITGG|nr:hypothetical protein Ngar_c18940 [Candidatus Nitrososphaera gargensis Ga9.2]
MTNKIPCKQHGTEKMMMDRLYKRGSKQNDQQFEEIGGYCEKCGYIEYDSALLNHKREKRLQDC